MKLASMSHFCERLKGKDNNDSACRDHLDQLSMRVSAGAQQWRWWGCALASHTGWSHLRPRGLQSAGPGSAPLVPSRTWAEWGLRGKGRGGPCTPCPGACPEGGGADSTPPERTTAIQNTPQAHPTLRLPGAWGCRLARVPGRITRCKRDPM